jgi:DNA polymerase-2
LPAIVARVWDGRDVAKRDGNTPLAQALKIIMNAFYGVLGSSGCRCWRVVWPSMKSTSEFSP